MSKLSKKILQHFSETELLAMLCASSVLREEYQFEFLLNYISQTAISSKKVYECLLQTYLFAGFPSALISLKRLNYFYPEKRKAEKYDLKTFTARGVKNCKSIYGKNYNKLIENVSSFSPELADWLIIEGYGKVLGRTTLSLKQREMCNVSILAALKFEDQLFSHISGAFRTRNKLNEINTVLNNLGYISNSSKNFGLRVLHTYLDRKRKSTN